MNQTHRDFMGTAALAAMEMRRAMLLLIALPLGLFGGTNPGTLSADGKVLTVTVGMGAEDTFDATTLLGNVSSVTNFVKAGFGLLDFPESVDLSSYSGAVRIEQGTYRISCSNQVGDVSSGNGGVVRICAGGALELRPIGTKNMIRFPKKTFCLNGAGPTGEGCVIYNPRSGIDQEGPSLGNVIEIESDALVSVTNQQHVYWNVNPMTVNLHGHRLRVRGVSNKLVAFGYPVVKDPQGGEIVLERAEMKMMNCADTSRGFCGEGTVVVSNTAIFHLCDLHAAGFPWSLRMDAGTPTVQATSQRMVANAVNTNYNVISGSTELNAAQVNVYLAKGNVNVSALTFAGPIHGKSAINVRNVNAVDAKLHLVSPDNDFSGLLSLNGVQLCLWNNGALPMSGAGVFASNSVLRCSDAVGFWQLPGAEFAGSGRVDRAFGRWNGKVVKSGAGELVYDALFDGDELEVKGGAVRMTSAVGRARYAGLMEGVRYFVNGNSIYPGGPSYAAAGNAAQAAYNLNMVNTNDHVSGMLALYSRPYVSVSGDNFWDYTLKRDPPYEGTDAASYVTYAGWIWNDGSEAETWTFAGSVGTWCSLMINGKAVFEKGGWSNVEIGRGTAVLQPGANRILYKVYAPSSGTGPRYAASLENAVWAPNMGLAYRRCEDTAEKIDVANYSKLIDPGDGSLLTYRRPEDDDCPIPGTGTVLPAGSGGVFTTVSCAAGTVLDFAGGSYRFTDLKGIPQVEDADELTIDGTWTIDVADIVSGAKLAAGKISFGPSAAIRIVNPGSVRGARGQYVLTQGEVVGLPELVVEDKRAWKVSKTDDGIVLTCIPNGMILLFR